MAENIREGPENRRNGTGGCRVHRLRNKKLSREEGSLNLCSCLLPVSPFSAQFEVPPGPDTQTRQNTRYLQITYSLLLRASHGDLRGFKFDESAHETLRERIRISGKLSTARNLRKFRTISGIFGRMEHSVLDIKSRLTSFPDLFCRAEHASNKDGGLKRDNKASRLDSSLWPSIAFNYTIIVFIDA